MSSINDQARIICKKAKKMNVKLSYNQCLDLLASIDGYDCWSARKNTVGNSPVKIDKKSISVEKNTISLKKETLGDHKFFKNGEVVIVKNVSEELNGKEFRIKGIAQEGLVTIYIVSCSGELFNGFETIAIPEYNLERVNSVDDNYFRIHFYESYVNSWERDVKLPKNPSWDQLADFDDNAILNAIGLDSKKDLNGIKITVSRITKEEFENVF